jgi:hypothetical protein
VEPRLGKLLISFCYASEHALCRHWGVDILNTIAILSQLDGPDRNTLQTISQREFGRIACLVDGRPGASDGLLPIDSIPKMITCRELRTP